MFGDNMDRRVPEGLEERLARLMDLLGLGEDGTAPVATKTEQRRGQGPPGARDRQAVRPARGPARGARGTPTRPPRAAAGEAVRAQGAAAARAGRGAAAAGFFRQALEQAVRAGREVTVTEGPEALERELATIGAAIEEAAADEDVSEWTWT